MTEFSELEKKLKEEREDRLMEAVRKVAGEQKLSEEFVMKGLLRQTEKGLTYEEALQKAWGCNIKHDEELKRMEEIKMRGEK